MLTLYLDVFYLVAIFVALAVAALAGLWQYNAQAATDAVRPIILSEAARAEISQTRNKILQEAIEAKRVRKAEYRRSQKAGRQPVPIDGASAGGQFPDGANRTSASSSPSGNG